MKPFGFLGQHNPPRLLKPKRLCSATNQGTRPYHYRKGKAVQMSKFLAYGTANNPSRLLKPERLYGATGQGTRPGYHASIHRQPVWLSESIPHTVFIILDLLFFSKDQAGLATVDVRSHSGSLTGCLIRFGYTQGVARGLLQCKAFGLLDSIDSPKD